MIKHYLLVAFRNFRRTPVIAAVNVLTLSLGLICFVAAYAIVSYWNHAETGFARAERTYVMSSDLTLRDGSVATGEMARSPDFLADYLKTDFPQLEAVARARTGADIAVTVDGVAQRLPVSYADPEFLDIFDLPFLKGDRATALDQPEGVVLTKAGAMKLYGTADVVGRHLRVSDVDATVTGVISDIPQPSHIGDKQSSILRFELLVSYRLYDRFVERFLAAQMEQMRARGRAPQQPANGGQGQANQANGGQKQPPPQNQPPQMQNWLGGYCCMTYVVLPEDGSLTASRFKAGMAEFVERHVPETQRSIAEVKVGALPVGDLVVSNLNSLLFARTAPGLSVTMVLMALGGLVLAVAGLNYANIATARATQRAREVGVRKAVGAARRQVMFQYILEAALLTTVALGVALVVLQLLRRPLMNAADVDVGLVDGSGAGFWLFLVAVIAGVSVLAGAYPAFVLSRVRPMDALRLGKVKTGPRFVPSLLVGMQFAAASFLMIAVIVMYMQNRDLRRTGLGAQEDPTLVITNISQFTGVQPELLRDELARIPQVTSVSGSSAMLWSMNVGLNILSRSPEESAKQISAMQLPVDYGYFDSSDIRLLAGRVFDRAHGEDAPRAQQVPGQPGGAPINIVADDTFIRQLGYKTPQEAVDTLVYMPERLTKAFGGTGPQPMRIIGVVETRTQAFLGLGASSTVYQLNDLPMYVLARVDKADVSGGRAAIEALWKRLSPTQPLIMQFSDDLFEQSYKTFGTINSAFAGLAIFALVISAIGLFGIAIQVTSRRLTEIGVRKTIGASTRQIMGMLLTDFSKPVVVANLVAWPLGFLAARLYLNVFMHRISLNALPFMASLALAILIAWVAVGTMAWKAARANPAKVLKYE